MTKREQIIRQLEDIKSDYVLQSEVRKAINKTIEYLKYEVYNNVELEDGGNKSE